MLNLSRKILGAAGLLVLAASLLVLMGQPKPATPVRAEWKTPTRTPTRVATRTPTRTPTRAATLARTATPTQVLPTAAPVSLGQYIVLAWNDLGMHCYNRDF